MKKLILIISLLFTSLTIYAQRVDPNSIISSNLSPSGLMDNVFDQLGNKYNLIDIQTDRERVSKSGAILTTSNPIVAGYFNLFFETNSGMENDTNPIHLARRNVVIQVFQDISAFINSPLSTNGLNNKVNIWVRDINQINGVPSTVLGLATAFYNMPNNTATGFGGIADNEIWKTIHAGVNSYTNVTSPLIAAGISSGTSGIFYHGMMAFNFSNYTWNTNRGVLANSTQYDLYTTVLHEVTHALGFVSLIGETGSSKFANGFNYYSRYDKFLKTSLNQNLLVSGSTCSSMYDYSFNSSLVNTLHPNADCSTPNNTTCSTAIKFSGTPNTLTPIPVFTPNCWSQGSSISHFEDGCFTSPPGFPSGNDLYFSMSNANGLGINKRYLKKEERLALVDLGYSIQPIYGVASTLQGIPPANYYGSNITNGINVAGINDGISNSGGFIFFGNANTTVVINSSTDTSKRILSNDFNATSFECLKDIYDTTATFNGLTSISGNATTNINFLSTNPGVHLLRYVPVNGTQKGNITYIYVYVMDSSNCATISNCNVVMNGDFEQYSQIPSGPSQLNFACGWSTINVANPNADYLNSSSPFVVDVPCSVFGYQTSNNNSGNGYAGFYLIREGRPGQIFTESIKTKLASKLLANTKYQLSFDISLAEAASFNAATIQAFLSTQLIQNSDGYGSIPIDNPNMLFTNPTISTNTNGWEKITFTVTTGSVSGEEYLYIGGLNQNNLYGTNNNIRFQSNTFAGPNIGGCNYTPVDFGTWTAQGLTYYFIDNVSIIQLSQAELNLPGSVCQTQVFPNLRDFLLPAPIGGVFSGNGVSFSGGFYSFNASTAGIGTHIIEYKYTNNLGCLISLYSNITVSPCSSTSCPGILVFNTIEPSTLATYQAASSITTNTNYLVNSGLTITLKAGNTITFSPDSEVKAGSDFTAQIGPCTQTSARYADEEENSIISKDELKLYPNPTNGLLSIDMPTCKFAKISILSLDGKLIFEKRIEPTNFYQVDVSSYNNGLYILTIETTDAKNINKKIIKN